MQSNNQNQSKRQYKSFWPIIAIAVLSFLIGGAFIWAIYNTSLEDQISSLMPGTFKALTEKRATLQEMKGWKTYRNDQYGFEFKYPYKDLSIAEGYISSIDPPNLVYVVNIYTIPRGQDRNGLVGVFHSSLDQILQHLDLSSRPRQKVSSNGITWTKISTDYPSLSSISYFIERNGSVFWFDYGFTTFVEQAHFETILSTFRFTGQINGWKTYKNTKYGFEFQYPSGLVIEPTDKAVTFRESDGPTEISVHILDNPQNESPRAFALKDFSIYDDPALVKTDLFVGNNAALSLRHPDLSGITYYIFKSSLMIELFLDLGQQTNQQIVSTFKFMEQTVDTSGWKTYQNEKYGFEFQYPASWIIEEDNIYPFGIRLMPKDFQKNRRDLMISIDPINVGRESAFDAGKENLVSCKIQDATFGGRKSKVCVAQSIYGYSKYIRVVDLVNINWGKSNEISFMFNLEGELTLNEYNGLLSVYNQILSTFKFIK